MTGRIVVVGLGPGPDDQLSVAAAAAIERIPTRFVRTSRHPSATAVRNPVSFDDIYEREPSLDHVYQAVVEALVEAAASSDAGEVLYAVPGSPLVAER
ncbi:MAG TPA: SAM-dependent methyltransferase, partial [Acidimicrobiales bacterium]|nr:SAM-dependent methyltransferase [Acidimicrobiales bacterium]